MVVLCSLAWVILAPVQIGGQTALVIISGNSMEPGFHLGDLAIIRRAPTYDIGDVVTYHHPGIGQVIHRIVERDGERFVLKGDNNSWLDTHRPDRSEIVGRLWLHVPGVGKVISGLRTPQRMALFGAFIGMFIMASGTHSPSRSHGPRGAAPQRRAPGGNPFTGEIGQALLTGLTIVALASLLLSVFAWTRPVERVVTDDITYEHSGDFDYTATVPAGVYDNAAVTTGEPVFRRLTNTISFKYRYRLDADLPTEAHGTYRFVATLSDVNGWKRTVELQPETPFSGTSFVAGGIINLADIQTLIDGVEAETGIQRASYTLSITPEVRVQGSVAGQSFSDHFTPRLQFLLDPLQLQLAPEAVTGNRDNYLRPRQPALLKHQRLEPATMSLLAWDFDVAATRAWSLAALGIALAGLALPGLRLLRGLQGDEAAQIRARHGSLLLTIQRWSPQPTDRRVDVTVFTDLVRIARQTGQMILHQKSETGDHYYVQDGALLYHYQTSQHTSDTFLTPLEASP